MKLLLVLFLCLPTLAIADGDKIYKVKCVSCHSPDGSGSAGFSPKLAGQHWEYTRDQIKDIRDGKRTNGNSGMMVSSFKTLSESEIDSVAKYLEGLK